MPEPSTPELNAKRPFFAAPTRINDTLRFVFWNSTELRAGYRLVLYLVLFSALVSGLFFAAKNLGLPRMTGPEITPLSAMVQETISVFSAVAAAAILGRLEGRRLGQFGLPARAAFGIRFWQGLAWGIVMITIMILPIKVLGGLAFGGLALSGSSILGYALAWGIAFLTVGFFEEFFFRGYSLFTLATGVGFWPAATILSAIFGAGHLANGGEGPVGALSVFVIGMFFCFTLRRTGNLWFAVGLHAAFDWGETYLYSVPDSGMLATGHLLNTTFHGPAWLTGGTIGPEGSVIAFVVMGLTAVVFNWVYPAQEEVAHDEGITQAV